MLLFFCLVPFFLMCFVVVPFVVLIVVVVAVIVAIYLYLLQVFECRFTASISIFGPSSAAGQQRRNPFLSPLTRSCFYTLRRVV